MLVFRFPAFGACRDCSQPGWGGPAELPFTTFDSICRGAACTDAGYPRISVNEANLTLFVGVTDLVFDGPAPALSLERSYNMDDTTSVGFGVGWSFNLGESLTAQSDGSLVLRRGSGRIDRFAPRAVSNSYFAVTSTSGTLSQNADGTYTLRTPFSTTTHVFSAAGRLLAIQDSGAPRVSLSYDTSGRLTTANYRGRPINFSYDGAGDITSVSDAAGRNIGFTYTADGHLAQQTNADGQTVAYQYNGSGQLTAISYGGNTTNIAFNIDGPYASVSGVTTPDNATRQYGTPLSPLEIQATDGNGDSTYLVFTALGMLQSATDAAGNVTSYTYDAAGHRTSATSASGETTQFTYDANGNLVSVTDPAGNLWTAGYTSAGVARITDPNQNTWQFRYDATGNLTSVTNPANGAVTAARDSTGRIASLTNPNGISTFFSYDGNGLLAAYTSGIPPCNPGPLCGVLTGAWSYQYDNAGRVSTRTDPGGATITASYNAGNRPASLAAGNTNLTYNFSGLQRDGLRRLTGYTDSFGNQVTYSYDGDGQLTGITFPGGNTISYQYDHAHHLSAVSDWLGNFALYRYDNFGVARSISVSGGPVVLRQFDAARNLKAVVSTGPDGTPVAGFSYTVDANGNRTAVSALQASAAPLGISQGSFTYDNANHPVSGSNGQSYSYDARGNLVTMQGPGSGTLSYDPFGRLVSLNGSASASYTYDSTGLRNVRIVNGNERHFVYDFSGPSPRVVMETDAFNNPIAYYVYGLGLLWEVTAGGTPYFYHFDGDGNTVAVSNPAAGVVNTYEYDPLGRLSNASENVENLFRARGEAGWIDDGDGLLYTGDAYQFPALRLKLPASVDLSPPQPGLLPQLRAGGACFLEGVAQCGFATGRNGRP